MDQSLREWLNKIESKQDKTNDAVVKLTTMVEMYLPKHDKLEERVDNIENDVRNIKADNTAKHRNTNLLVAIGAVVAVIAGVLIDHFLLK